MALRLDKEDRLIFGVCSGLAKKMDGMDATVVRLAFVLAFLFFGIGPVIYLILWLVMLASENE